MKKQIILFLALLFALPVMADERSDREKLRGNPWEYDQGPEYDSEILQHLMSLPNYRTLGRKVMGAFGEREQERFRWHWGPVFYRGRLGKNQVKVLIIGQEGGQDEAFSKRAFTGGTGQSMQHFLNYIGLNQNYLFLNTFIYSIRSQYQDVEVDEKTKDEKLPNAFEGDVWLAQSLESPIARHRNELFDLVLKQNPDLRLVVAVGSGAKDSVQTWVKAHGGECTKFRDVSSCDASVLGPNVELIGVLHPGAKGQAKNDAERKQIAAGLERSFQAAADRAARLIHLNPDWLPLDEGATRPNVLVQEDEEGNESVTFDKRYDDRNDPVPHRDFSFGLIWTMGKGSTTSNRQGASIVPFSDDGHYAKNRKYEVYFPRSESINKIEYSGYQEIEGDVSYEPTKSDLNAYDRGPGSEFAKLLMGGEEGLHWPDFEKLGAVSHASFGHGAVFRGRLDEATVLVVADQHSHDDMMRGRALIGDAGQKLQHFLRNMGITQSYAIIRTLPVDTLGLDAKKVRKISTHKQVERVRKAVLERILSRNNTLVILTVGEHAADAVSKLNTDKISVFNLKSASDKNAAEDWSKQLKRILKVKYPRDDQKLERAFTYKDKDWKNTRLEINRRDLPFGTVRWIGTSGNLTERALKDRRGNYTPGDYYKISMPGWANAEKASRLSKEESAALSDGGWLDKRPREERRVDRMRAERKGK